MNFKASYQYQFHDQVKACSVFFLVCILSYILVAVSALSMHVNGVSVEFSGIEFGAIVFIFVMGLCSFKENFLMLMQNGLSRKSLFAGRIAVNLTLALILTIGNRIFAMISHVAGAIGVRGWTIFQLIYTEMDHLSVVQSFFYSVCFDFFVLSSVIAIGYFITLLFYRLNKKGKILVGAGVPIVLYLIFPIIDLWIFKGKLSKMLAQFLLWAYGAGNKPIHAIITSLILFGLFTGFTWLLLRRISVKTS